MVPERESPSSPFEASLQVQIRQSVVEAILARAILPGDKLASSRALAKQLGVSRNTVASLARGSVRDMWSVTMHRLRGWWHRLGGGGQAMGLWCPGAWVEAEQPEEMGELATPKQAGLTLLLEQGLGAQHLEQVLEAHLLEWGLAMRPLEQGLLEQGLAMQPSELGLVMWLANRRLETAVWSGVRN